MLKHVHTHEWEITERLSRSLLHRGAHTECLVEGKFSLAYWRIGHRIFEFKIRVIRWLPIGHMRVSNWCETNTPIDQGSFQSRYDS